VTRVATGQVNAKRES